MKKALFYLTLTAVFGCSSSGGNPPLTTSEKAANSGQIASNCPNTPQGSLTQQNVKPISLGTQPIAESGQIREGQNLAYTFKGKIGQRFNFSSKENICVWLYTPNNRVLKSSELPENGNYIVQVSTPQGVTMFNLAMSLTSAQPLPVASINLPDKSPTSSATPSFFPRVSPSPTEPKAAISVRSQRVEFAQGSTSTSIQGNIHSRQQVQYLLWCKEGQYMSLQTSEGSIDITVIDPDGSTIGSLRSDNRRWRGKLPSSGDYILKVSVSGNSRYTINVEVL